MNRRPQELDAPALRQQARPVGALPEVVRDDGRQEGAAADAFARLGDRLGRLADDFAVATAAKEGAAAGAEGKPRLTNVPTAAGRAFDRAAVDTYYDRLQADMRDRAYQVYEKNRDNPAAVVEGMRALEGEMLANDVMPEVATRFRADFQRLRLPLQFEALREADQRLRSQRRAAFGNALDAGSREEDRAAESAGVNPALAPGLDQARGARNATIDRAVADGTIDADTGERIKRTRDADTAIGLTAAGIMRLPADERPAAIERLREDWRAGRLPQLSREAFDRVQAMVEGRTAREATAARQAGGEVMAEVRSVTERLQQGFRIAPEEFDRIGARVAASGTREAREAWETVAEMRDFAARVDGRSPADVRIMAREARAAANENGATGREARFVRFAEAWTRTYEQNLARDPLGTAVGSGVVRIDALDFTSPDALAAGLSRRQAAAEATAAHYRVDNVPLLLPTETQALKDLYQREPERIADVAAAAVRGLGVQGAARFWQAIAGRDAPEMAHLGGLAAAGGSPEAVRDALTALRLAREGAQLTPPKAEDWRKLVSDTFGNAFSGARETDRASIATNASRIYQTRAFRERRDGDVAQPQNKAIATRALQEAAGAVFVDGRQFGGVVERSVRGLFGSSWFGARERVVIPSNVRADGFDQLVGAVTDEDLASLPVPPVLRGGERPVPAADIRAGSLVAVAPGRYRVYLGDPMDPATLQVMGRDGRPFTLDLTALEPRLRARRPDLYLGGRR